MRRQLFNELRKRTPVSAEMWEAAAERSERMGSSLTAQLIGQGVEPAALLDAFSTVSGLPPAPPERVRHPACEGVRGFDPILCWRALIVPFAISGGKLHVAFADPEVALDAEALGVPFHTAYLALPDDITVGLKALFGARPALDTLYVPNVTATELDDADGLEVPTTPDGAASRTRVDPSAATVHRPPEPQTVPAPITLESMRTTRPDSGALSLPPSQPTEPGLVAPPAALLPSTKEGGALDPSGTDRAIVPLAPRPPPPELRSDASGAAAASFDAASPAIPRGRFGLGVGDVLGGYRISRRLGGGGMADVFLAEPADGGAAVALKVIHGHRLADAVFVERFHREVQASMALVHENIVRVYSQGEDDGLHFMVAEYCGGGTVQELLDRMGRLPARLAARVVDDVLAGLGYAHALGVIHRDIKPANLLIGADGRVKIGDFGIAKQTGDATLTRTGFLVGTPAYVSPEQAVGDPIDGRSDLFTVGVLLYELLTGANPFFNEAPSVSLLKISEVRAPPIYEAEPAVPGAIERLMGGLLQRSADHRFPDAELARRALAPLLENTDASLLLRALDDPRGTRALLVDEQARAEKRRADALLGREPPKTLAAVIALHRATLLEPNARDLALAFRDVVAKSGFDFSTPTNPKWAETLAALEDTPTAPGLLKRAAELARAHGNLALYALYLRRYLELRPDDAHAADTLGRLLGEDDATASWPFAAGSTRSRSRLGAETRGLIEGIKTGGFKARPLDSRDGDVVVGALVAEPATKAPVVERAPMSVVSFSDDPASMSALDWVRGVWSALGGKIVIGVLVLAVIVGGYRLVDGFIRSSQEGMDQSFDNLEKNAQAQANELLRRQNRSFLIQAERQLELGDARGARVLAVQVEASEGEGPMFIDALLLRARCDIDLGAPERAREALDRVIELAPASSPAATKAEELLASLGEP